MKPIRVAVIGCGFMGRTHANAHCQVNHFFPELEHHPVLQVAVAHPSEKEKLEKYAKTWGFAETSTDWKSVVARDDIDMIDVCVPNNLHAEIVIAAAKAGKIISCEKPLAMSVEQAIEMRDVVEASGVPHMISFNYRRVPAVSLAKQIIGEGRIGRPFHYRATYNQDYTISTKVPQGGAALWRLDAKVAGSGVTGDLLAHSIDTAEWLNGPIKRLCAHTEIFVKERMHIETGKMEPVTIDDAAMFMAIFENGSIGTFESTRYARGRKNYNTFEMNGEFGAFHFDLERPEYLQFFRYADPDTGKKVEDHLTGWQDILVTNSEHPYMSHYWVPGTMIGYEHTFINGLSDFLKSMEGGPAYEPSIRQATRTQAVCDAVVKSAKEERWVEISELLP